MSIYPNVIEQDLINFNKLSEQQKINVQLYLKNRILKQTHDNKAAGSLSPINKKLDVNNECTNQLSEIVIKSDVENGNTQTPAIENITGTQSLCGTLSFRKKSKILFKLKDKDMVMYFGIKSVLNH